jgi:anti-anti-sigma factor
VCGCASWVRSREVAATVVTAAGDLDFTCAAAFAAALTAIAGEGSDVIIDMAGVAFMDSTVLDTVVRAERLYEALGLVLVLRAPSRSVRRLVALCRLEDLVEQPPGRS